MSTAASSLSDLGARLRSSAVMVVLAGAPLLFGGMPGMALIAAAGAAMAWEWRKITMADAFEPLWGYSFAAVAALGVFLGHVTGIAGAFLYLIVASAALGGLDAVEKRDWRWAPLGLMSVGLAAASFAALRDEPQFGLATALWIVCVVVATDVGGYFAGRKIGGPKLWPAVSPGKTWSGLAGGATLAFIVGGLFSWATTGTYAAQVCIVSVLAALVAQGGDLSESALKRRFGIKDSGALIPGHGGVLDRLDGFCAATLVAAGVAFLRGKPVFLW